MVLDAELGVVGEWVHTQRERRFFIEPAPATDLEADDIIGHNLDAQLLAVEICGQPSRGRSHRVDPLEPDIVLDVDHSTSSWCHRVTPS